MASPALSLAVWLVCGALVLAGELTLGELALRYPRAGGLYVYLEEGWRERIAFLYGWQSLLVMDPGITAALATALSGYTGLLWPAATGSEVWVAVGVIWVLAIVGMIGLTPSARVLRAMTILKVLAFGLVVIAPFVAGAGTWAHFAPFVPRQASAPPIGEAMTPGLVSVFFSFGGFWDASRVTNEVRDAPRTMPLSLWIGVTSVTAVYIATTVAFIYAVPIGQATNASEFAHRTGEVLFGQSGASVRSLAF